MVINTCKNSQKRESNDITRFFKIDASSIPENQEILRLRAEQKRSLIHYLPRKSRRYVQKMLELPNINAHQNPNQQENENKVTLYI